MFGDAADLLLEGWYWMPEMILVDLVLFHALVRWHRRRGERIE